jgi:hypothetical protein
LVHPGWLGGKLVGVHSAQLGWPPYCGFHGGQGRRCRASFSLSSPDDWPRHTTTKTFLIADVRGYTAFRERRGDAAAGILAGRFAEITREVVESFDGLVVEFRGDEAVGVFDSPRAALGAAVELQRRLVEATCQDESCPLPTGIGLDGRSGPRREQLPRRRSEPCGQAMRIAGPGEMPASHEVIHLASRTHVMINEERGPVKVNSHSSV